jgi:parallel beta-helix repeat protein
MMKKNNRFLKKLNYFWLLSLVLVSLRNDAQTNFVVTLTTDPAIGGTAVTGQLRWAMEQANALSTPSLITFNISGTGPFTINPKAPLPVISKTVNLDGTSQPGYDPNDPAIPFIIIDGTNSPSNLATGVSFLNSSNSKLSGIYIKNCITGLSLNGCTSCEVTNNVINMVSGTCFNLQSSAFCTIKGNYINTNKVLSQLSVNSAEGIYIKSSNDNIIGGLGCGEGNTIGYVTTEGIDNQSNPGQRNRYSGNRVFGCTTKEIYLRVTGNNGKADPIITSTGCITSGTSAANDIIEIFGSTGNPGQRRNAKIYMGTTKADASGNWSIQLSNILYPYVTGTATDAANNSSELGYVAAITLDTLKLKIINPSAMCAKETITFEKGGAKCWGGVNLVWDFGDGSQPSTSGSHKYLVPGTYAVKLTAYDKNNCDTKTVTSNAVVTTCGAFDCANLPCLLDVNLSGPVQGNGGANMFFSASPVGGTPPYTYQWFNPSTNLKPLSNTTTSTVQTANVGTADCIIWVTVTDKNGCTVTKSVGVSSQF